MMLEAGSNPRVRNRARLTPAQLVDPANKELKELIEKYEFATQNAGDFVVVDSAAAAGGNAVQQQQQQQDIDEDAEFSGSDEEERAEWERRRREKKR
jgi:hypothetical protein